MAIDGMVFFFGFGCLFAEQDIEEVEQEGNKSCKGKVWCPHSKEAGKGPEIRQSHQKVLHNWADSWSKRTSEEDFHRRQRPSKHSHVSDTFLYDGVQTLVPGLFKYGRACCATCATRVKKVNDSHSWLWVPAQLRACFLLHSVELCWIMLISDYPRLSEMSWNCRCSRAVFGHELIAPSSNSACWEKNVHKRS